MTCVARTAQFCETAGAPAHSNKHFVDHTSQDEDVLFTVQPPASPDDAEQQPGYSQWM